MDGGASRSLNRRTLLVGAAGALAAAGLSAPVRAAAHRALVAASSGPRFDPALARQLQRALHDALRDPSIHAPGAILHVRSAKLGAWTGVAGLGRVAPDVPMRPNDRFRAGSIVKPFVSATVLQLAERGRLSLDAKLPDVLPASVIGRFPTAPDVTVRMLLSHRSGIPEWDLPAIDEQIARDPLKVWTVSEFLDLAAAQPPAFAPGTNYKYCNTEYNLLSLIIEGLTGGSWRKAVTRGVITPLGLRHTTLPAPGNASIKGAHAHAYGELDGRTVDQTRVDPSIAGAAGGGALVTTVQDLTRFLDALLKGRLFRHRDTLRQMLTFAPAPDVGGQVGYGLGVEQRIFPGNVEMIGHLGTAAGYNAYVARLPAQHVTIASAINWAEDPSPLLLPAVHALATTHR
ncbi:serine hydrolase domain-containing protein [Capillimicrobium parvum]|uniref:serine hydrolase domain-containing protein n=1 Tax=Capillimicrobium parvum TaxID=2884022 RepID=UPI00216B1E1B|nr:serine hydrolase domain-containing protein [Capillimicrobium parvum]